MSLNIKQLGQVFTKDNIVDLMISLVQNHGAILEPSCGDGAFTRRLLELGRDNFEAVEIDPKVAPNYANIMDFFDFDHEFAFETVIGNPPYVRFQDIPESTKSKLDMEIFDNRSNLFLFFIERCFYHLDFMGEMIFIVPRELMTLTSAKRLNKMLLEWGSFTHWIECGDAKIFDGASPNCAIFRYVKGRPCLPTTYMSALDAAPVRRTVFESEGRFCFPSTQLTVKFSDLFEVKVGGVSGADEIFTSPNGNLDFVNSTTRKTGETRRMHYNWKHPDLSPHMFKLMNRGIRKFTVNNWWEWGRKFPESDKPRVYVNCKTRQNNPFFTHPSTAFDGSVLAIFPKFEADIDELVSLFNGVDWNGLGMMVGGRYVFSQDALQNCHLPCEFEKFVGK